MRRGQGEPQHGPGLPGVVRQRRVQGHAPGGDAGRGAGVHDEVRTGLRVRGAVAAAAVRDDCQRLPARRREPDERRTVTLPPAGGEGDPPRAHPGTAGERLEGAGRLFRPGRVAGRGGANQLPGERRTDGFGYESCGRLQRAAAGRAAPPVAARSTQHAAQHAERARHRDAHRLVGIAAARRQRGGGLRIGQDRTLQDAGGEAQERGPELPRQQRGGRIDGRDGGVGVDAGPRALGQRQRRLLRRDHQVRASEQAHGDGGRYPDDVAVLRGQHGTGPVAHVRLRLDLHGVAGRGATADGELGEAGDPGVDPGNGSQVELAAGDAGALAVDDDRIETGDREEAEDALRPRRVRDPAGAQRHLAGRHPGDELPAPHGPVSRQLDGEDVQEPPFHEMDPLGVVHHERVRGVGLPPHAAEAFKDGSRHGRLHPSPTCGRGLPPRSGAGACRAARSGPGRARRSRPRPGWC